MDTQFEFHWTKTQLDAPAIIILINLNRIQNKNKIYKQNSSAWRMHFVISHWGSGTCISTSSCFGYKNIIFLKCMIEQQKLRILSI
jgi:hypothetical protein